MKRCCLLFALLLVVPLHADAQEKKPISWKKIVVDNVFRSEGVGVADFNKDGRVDIVVGDCWYESPKDLAGEWKRHILRLDRKFGLLEYSKSFCCFPDDFNGDGYPDVIVIPFPGDPCYWYENPGAKGGLWTAHLVTNSACNETPIYVDLFKTGQKRLVMGWQPNKDASDPKKGTHDKLGEMCYFVPGKDPTLPWERVSISGPSTKAKEVPGTQKFSHGLGHGDVNGDGRIDVIVPQGWWEQPSQPGKFWKFHATTFIDENGKNSAALPACADMHVVDIDGDGKADFISSSAHNYGFWWSQQKDPKTFMRHVMFPDPFAVAKPPADLKLSADEKALFDAVNKVRKDQFTAPLALNATLCGAARRFAMVTARGLKVKFSAEEISKEYAGNLVKWQFGIAPADLGNKAYSEMLRQLPPGLEIGVGADEANGKKSHVLLVGDRGKFSLPSQTHALQHVDIDGDGLKDLVTGRRWWAHGPKGDAGPNDPAYLYWFQAKRGKDGITSFTPHQIDADSGMGTQFSVADMNGDGLPDIIVANKKGVHVFVQVR